MGNDMSVEDEFNDLEHKLNILYKTLFSLELNIDELSAFSSYFKVEVVKKADGILELYCNESLNKRNSKRFGINFQNLPRLKSVSGTFIPGQKLMCIKYVGDIIAEDLFLTDVKSPYTAIAAEQCVLLTCTKDSWNSFLITKLSKEAELRGVLARKIESDLQAIELFSNLADEELIFLSRLFHYVPVAAGQMLFDEDSSSSAMYGICGGVAKSHVVDDATKSEIIIGELKEGDIVGEVAAMLGIPRLSRITARRNLLLLEIKKTELNFMLEYFPHIKILINNLIKKRLLERFQAYGVPFFLNIPFDSLKELGELCDIDIHEPKAVIFNNGAVVNKLHIIVKGEACIVTNKDDDEDLISVASAGPGKYFGEVNLIKDIPRTESLLALHKCIVLSFSRENLHKFFFTNPEKLADFYLKLAGNDIELEKYIYHPIGVQLFAKFLETEHNVENIKFWLAVKEYSNISVKDPKGLRPKLGQEIYDQYIKGDAPEQVNLDSKSQLFVSGEVSKNNFTPELYDSCAHEILLLMNANYSLKRFKQSDAFKEFISSHK